MQCFPFPERLLQQITKLYEALMSGQGELVENSYTKAVGTISCFSCFLPSGKTPYYSVQKVQLRYWLPFHTK